MLGRLHVGAAPSVSLASSNHPAHQSTPSSPPTSGLQISARIWQTFFSSLFRLSRLVQPRWRSSPPSLAMRKATPCVEEHLRRKSLHTRRKSTHKSGCRPPSLIPMNPCVEDHTIAPLVEGEGKNSFRKEKKRPRHGPSRMNFSYFLDYFVARLRRAR